MREKKKEKFILRLTTILRAKGLIRYEENGSTALVSTKGPNSITTPGPRLWLRHDEHEEPIRGTRTKMREEGTERV